MGAGFAVNGFRFTACTRLEKCFQPRNLSCFTYLYSSPRVAGTLPRPAMDMKNNLMFYV